VLIATGAQPNGWAWASSPRTPTRASSPATITCTRQTSANSRPRSQPEVASCREHWTLSSSDLAGLEDLDGLGDLPGVPRAAAELAQGAPRSWAERSRAHRAIWPAVLPAAGPRPGRWTSERDL